MLKMIKMLTLWGKMLKLLKMIRLRLFFGVACLNLRAGAFPIAVFSLLAPRGAVL